MTLETVSFEMVIGIVHKKYYKSITHWDAAATKGEIVLAAEHKIQGTWYDVTYT